MRCKHCGFALPTEGVVCKNCGSMMDKHQIKNRSNIKFDKADSLRGVYSEGSHNEYKSKKGIIYLVLVMIFIILLVYMVSR